MLTLSFLPVLSRLSNHDGEPTDSHLKSPINPILDKGRSNSITVLRKDKNPKLYKTFSVCLTHNTVQSYTEIKKKKRDFVLLQTINLFE